MRSSMPSRRATRHYRTAKKFRTGFRKIEFTTSKSVGSLGKCQRVFVPLPMDSIPNEFFASRIVDFLNPSAPNNSHMSEANLSPSFRISKSRDSQAIRSLAGRPGFGAFVCFCMRTISSPRKFLILASTISTVPSGGAIRYETAVWSYPQFTFSGTKTRLVCSSGSTNTSQRQAIARSTTSDARMSIGRAMRFECRLRKQ